MEKEQKLVVLDDVKKVEQAKIEETFQTYEIALPSKGKIYDSTHPLHNKEIVEIREMTAKEEDILTSRLLLKKGVAIDKVIDNCLIDKRIKQDDLLSGDRNTILLYLRIISYGTDYPISVQCPLCEIQNEQHFDLAKTKIKTLEVESTEPFKNEFEFTLPKTNAKIKFKILTVGEESIISKTQESLRKNTGSEIDSFVTAKLLKQIISVNDNTDKQFVYKFVQRMPILDSRALRDYVEKIQPDVEMTNMMNCNKCGEQSEVELPITTEFFWPKGNR